MTKRERGDWSLDSREERERRERHVVKDFHSIHLPFYRTLAFPFFSYQFVPSMRAVGKRGEEDQRRGRR